MKKIPSWLLILVLLGIGAAIFFLWQQTYTPPADTGFDPNNPGEYEGAGLVNVKSIFNKFSLADGNVKTYNLPENAVPIPTDHMTRISPIKAARDPKKAAASVDRLIRNPNEAVDIATRLIKNPNEAVEGIKKWFK